MKPETVLVRAIDAVPYRYALWCSIEDGDPFTNLIVLRGATDDGRIRFMLDTHNFFWADPSEQLELVPVVPNSPEHQLRFEAEDKKRMQPLHDLPLLDREWAL